MQEDEEVTPEQHKAIIESLWEVWTKNPPKVPDNGNRIFLRWVQLNPDDLSWDDWSFVGIVKDGAVVWNNPEVAGRDDCRWIEKSILAGKRHGRIESKDKLTKEEWGLLLGDGPEEIRVSDWAGG